MRKIYKIILICLLFLSAKGYSQDSIPYNVNNEIWRQRINLGLSAGYPQVPFVNLGMKFHDKIYIEFFFEMNETYEYSSFFDIGCQSNHLFNKNLKGQVGLSLLQVPNKEENDKINKLGINLRLTKPLTSRFGLFISGHVGLPDDRTTYDNLANVNVGIEFYFKQVPFLIY